MSQKKYLIPTWPKINSLVQVHLGTKIKSTQYGQSFGMDVEFNDAFGIVVAHIEAPNWFLDRLEVLIAGELYSVSRSSASYEEQKYPYFDVVIL